MKPSVVFSSIYTGGLERRLPRNPAGIDLISLALFGVEMIITIVISSASTPLGTGSSEEIRDVNTFICSAVKPNAPPIALEIALRYNVSRNDIEKVFDLKLSKTLFWLKGDCFETFQVSRNDTKE